MIPEGSLPFSQEPATGLYPEPNGSTSTTQSHVNMNNLKMEGNILGLIITAEPV
jgi:hypothetical protein